jgi:hypothetical protein
MRLRDARKHLEQALKIRGGIDLGRESLRKRA